MVLHVIQVTGFIFHNTTICIVINIYFTFANFIFDGIISSYHLLIIKVVNAVSDNNNAADISG